LDMKHQSGVAPAMEVLTKHGKDQSTQSLREPCKRRTDL
jgi:hypothetical protein